MCLDKMAVFADYIPSNCLPRVQSERLFCFTDIELENRREQLVVLPDWAAAVNHQLSVQP